MGLKPAHVTFTHLLAKALIAREFDFSFLPCWWWNRLAQSDSLVLGTQGKGLEPLGHAPRALKGMGLALAVSDRGACHLRATVYKAELSGWADLSSVEGKVELVLDYQDRHTAFDTLILCRFYRDIIGWDDLPAIIRGLTGLELDKAGLQRLSARIANTIRRYNLREGMEQTDDTLPQRLLDEPQRPGGEMVAEAELRHMVSEYYAPRRWGESAQAQMRQIRAILKEIVGQEWHYGVEIGLLPLCGILSDLPEGVGFHA